MLERLVGHHRPQVGAANADVDDVADALAGVALPLAAADAVGEVGHLVEHGVDLRHDILAVHEDGCSFGRAQGHVQHGALLRDVDFLAAEHGVDPRSQAGFLGQLEQQLEGFVGDAVLRVIQEEARRLGRHALAALGVIREEIAQMQFLGSSCSGLGEPSRPCVSSAACDALALCVTLLRVAMLCSFRFAIVPNVSPAHSDDRPHLQLAAACLSALLLDAITAISSFQDFTNDFAPSS